MRLRRIFIGTAIVLAGCALSGTPAFAATKIVLGYLPVNDWLPTFVAKEKGYFEKRGLDVTLQRIAVGSTLPSVLVADSVQIGSLTAPVTLQAIEGGLDLVILAGASLATTRNQHTSVVARQGSNIRQPADFAGKKVGVPDLNGALDIMFRKWLKDSGADLKSVAFIETAFPQMSDMLKAGHLDAVIPVEPFRTRMIQANIGYHVVNPLAEVRDNNLITFYAATRKWAEANPDAVKAFREALREGLEFITGNLAEARSIEGKYTGLPPQVVQTIPLVTLTLNVKREDIQFWIDICRELGVIKGNIEASRVIFP